MKRQLRAKLSAEEQLAAEKAEAEKIREAELEALRKELDRNKAFNAYRSVSDEGIIEDLIGAVSEANHGAIAAIIEKYQESLFNKKTNDEGRLQADYSDQTSNSPNLK